MAWTPERQTVNQKVQIGAEATTALGTNVSASKLLECFDWVFGVEADTNLYTATGHKYPSVQEENTEWASATIGGNLDYNGVIYLLASSMGSVASASHGASSTAKDWIYTPPTLGSIVPQTYTVEQGDAVYAHKVNYLLVSEFGYKGTRKDFTISGKAMSQPLQNGITLTNSPTAVAIAPVVAKQVSVFLDPTQAALGTTIMTRVLSVDYAFTNVYGITWFLNRSTVGFTAHVDTVPQGKFKLKVEADGNGMGLVANYLQTGATAYVRVQAQGNIIDNLQTLTIGGGATGGTFTLSYKGQTTAAITYSAALTAATVNTAFQLLSTVSTNCTVSGSAGGPYTFTFGGALASDMSAVTVTNVSLSGGTPTVSLVAQAYNIFQHDMALKIGKPSPFGDDQGVFATEYECSVVEDPVWGKAQTVTVTNLLTAL